MGWFRRALIGVAAIWWGAAPLGCSPTEPADRPAEDRWARRYLPYQHSWIRESEIPAEPQESPAMVIWEQSRFAPGVEPTPEQERAAAELLERCYAAAERHGWYDFDKGLADGFEHMKNDGRHFRNTEYMLDDRILDPDHPEQLMYYPTPSGKFVLVGFMFFARSRDEWGLQIGGPLTVWHYHIWRRNRCFTHDLLVVDWEKNGKCEEGVAFHRSGEMMHVWLIDHPAGPFATSMMLPKQDVAQGIMKRRRERGF